MKRNPGNRVAALLAGTVLAGAFSEASAIAVIDLGAVPRTGVFTSGIVPQYAWDGWNGITPNLGWAHNSKWYTFTLARTATVQITMTSSVNRMKPAFSVWRTGGTFVGGNHLSHAYNQVGLSGSSDFLKPQSQGGDGATQFMGYVNGGTNFTNGDNKRVLAGTGNMSRRATRYAAFARTLSAGQYLIAAGGSCNAQNCGSPSPHDFKLNVQYLPLAGSGKSP